MSGLIAADFRGSFQRTFNKTNKQTMNSRIRATFGRGALALALLCGAVGSVAENAQPSLKVGPLELEKRKASSVESELTLSRDGKVPEVEAYETFLSVRQGFEANFGEGHVQRVNQNSPVYYDGSKLQLNEADRVLYGEIVRELESLMVESDQLRFRAMMLSRELKALVERGRPVALIKEYRGRAGETGYADEMALGIPANSEVKVTAKEDLDDEAL